MAVNQISQKNFTGVTDRERGAVGLSTDVLGINTAELGDLAKKPFEVKIDKNTDKIEENTKIIAAISELQKKVETSKSAVNGMRGLDPLKGVTNVFDSRIGAVLSNLNLDGNNYAALTAKDKTPVRTFTLEISQLATADKITSTAAPFAADPAAALGLTPGNLIINGQNIAVDGTTTMDGLATLINAVKLTTGVEATVINGNGEYRLELKPTADSTTGTVTVSDDQAGAIYGNINLIKNQYVPYGAVAGNLIVEGESIAITADQTIYDIKSSINAKTGTTGVQAYIDQLASGDLRLVFQRSETGEIMTLDDDQGGALLTSLRVSATSGKTADDLAAKFKFDGGATTLTRTTNDIEDLVEGATVKLLNTTGVGQTLTLGIDPNLNSLKDTMIDFVMSISEIEEFYIKQRTTPPEGDNPDGIGVLTKDTLLRDMMHEIHRQITSTVYGASSTDFKSLADIGITLEPTTVNSEPFNRIKLDPNKLANAIQTSPDKVEKLLAFKSSTTNSNFRIIESPVNLPSSLSGKDFQVTIWKDDSSGTEANYANFTLNGTSYAATIDSNGKIKGRTGTPFENFSIFVSSSQINALVNNGAKISSTINTTQGLMDKIGHYYDEALRLSPDTSSKTGYMMGGLFQAHIGEFKAKNDELKTTNVELNKKAENARERQLKTLDRVIQALQQIEGMRSQLNAFLGAQQQQS